ncbi:hypothetical protein AQUCO_00600020v1 [Aquilegia coerulea]|uniref:Phytocyanin domain-containing protein n=1 Tax=Aquilegia coerulea TaxID=218851 RepID=A0A2G5EMR5_AQUCA|nr:hypothetical protein AQUCO_00600020v1 [Aquilegia coerulea]
MAASVNRLVGFLFVVIALVSCTTAQTTHVVGDSSTGWTVPSGPTFYTNWASSQTFRVGDSLVFNFATGRHDVATVTRAAFDACNTSSTLGQVQTTSPVTITLSSQGPQYYFCTFQGHCSSGQKLAINVVGAAASPPTTTPTSPPPPPRTAAPPTRSATPPTTSTVPPTTTPTSSPPPSITNPPTNTATPPTTSTVQPPPSSSATGLVVSGFSVTFLSIAMAFFF